MKKLNIYTIFALLNTLLMLLFAPLARAATIYAKVIGGVVYYDAAASSCAEVTAADTSSDLEAAAVAAGTDGTLYICEGTYSGTEIDAADGLDTSGNITIMGVGSRDAVILDGSGLGDDVVNLGSGTVALGNLTIQGSDAVKYGVKTVATTTLTDVHIKNCSRSLYSLTSGDVHATRLEISGNTEAYAVALAYASATYQFDYCLFRDSAGSIAFFAATTATFDNCIFTNISPPSNGVFYNTSTYAISATFNNCVFFANTLNGSGAYQIFTNNAGTWTLNNTFITDSPIYYGRMIQNPGSAIVTINNSITTEPTPLWWRGGGTAKAYFFIDDTPYIDHWYNIADVANVAYGMPINMALTVNGTQSWTGTDWSKLAGYLDGSTTGVANGLSLHGYSNAYLWTSASDDAAGTVNAITANKAGSFITISVTRTDVDDSSTWAGTLQLDALTPIDLTSSSYDEMDEVVAYLAGQGVTLGTASGQVVYNHSFFIPHTIALKSGTYNINTTQTLVFDQHSLFVTEMKDAKATVEAALAPYISGFTINSFVWPGGYYGDNAITYAMDTIGFEQVRGVQGVGTYGTSFKSAEMRLYSTGSIYTDINITTTDPGAMTSGYFHSLVQVDGVGGVHGHYTTFSVADWTAVFAAASNTPGLEVMTYDDALDWLRANDDHVTSKVSYRCSDNTDACVTASFDYFLLPVSPLIDAGFNICSVLGGDVYDFAQRQICSGGDILGAGALDIGLYEYVFAPSKTLSWYRVIWRLWK